MYRNQLSVAARKFVFFIFTACMLSVSFFIPAYADDSTSGGISVFLNEEKMEFDVPPTVIQNKTYVPMRKIFEELGMGVTWDGSKQMIRAYGNGMDIRLKLGNTGILINGVRFEMDASPLSVSGRTLVPLRAVSQALGVDVKWDGKTKSVYLQGKPTLHPKAGSYFDGKKMRTNFSDDHYAMFTVDGDKLEVEANYSENSNKQLKMYFYYDYTHEITDTGFALPDERKNRLFNSKEWKEFYYDEKYTGKPIKNTFKLRNQLYHTIIIWMKGEENKDSSGGFPELSYDFIIEKKKNEYLFLVPEYYEANLDLMLQLDSPDKYTELQIYDEADRLAVVNLSNQICGDASTESSKVKKIHDWIVDNTYYNSDGFYEKKGLCYTSADVIRSKMTIAKGFANLFRDLLNAQGIPCVKIGGEVGRKYLSERITDPEYEWNLVYADGRWMVIDVTRNIRNTFINGEFEKINASYKYYDIDPFFFSYNHHMMEIK